jgi:hypothetical protein
LFMMFAMAARSADCQAAAEWVAGASHLFLIGPAASL